MSPRALFRFLSLERSFSMNRVSCSGRRAEFAVEGVALLLLAAFLLFSFSGCSSADAGVLTDADRAFVATELAAASLDDGGSGVFWKPLDDRPDVKPEPAPRPFTSARTVAITNGTASTVSGQLGQPVDISYSPEVCENGSCSSDGEFGERRRPVVGVVRGAGRVVGFIGRGLNRARPIRRVGGFLFCRRCG